MHGKRNPPKVPPSVNASPSPPRFATVSRLRIITQHVAQTPTQRFNDCCGRNFTVVQNRLML